MMVCLKFSNLACFCPFLICSVVSLHGENADHHWQYDVEMYSRKAEALKANGQTVVPAYLISCRLRGEVVADHTFDRIVISVGESTAQTLEGMGNWAVKVKVGKLALSKTAINEVVWVFDKPSDFEDPDVSDYFQLLGALLPSVQLVKSTATNPLKSCWTIKNNWTNATKRTVELTRLESGIWLMQEEQKMIAYHTTNSTISALQVLDSVQKDKLRYLLDRFSASKLVLADVFQDEFKSTSAYVAVYHVRASKAAHQTKP